MHHTSLRPASNLNMEEISVKRIPLGAKLHRVFRIMCAKLQDVI
jgi:hypothetical protein